jgi:two-component system nitrate/nitrite response regulator NarL
MHWEAVTVMRHPDEMGVNTEAVDPWRLLIVDDHELLAQTLHAVLEAEGYDVRRASSVASDAVLEEARVSQPHVVLLDLGLGGTSALPLVEPLRRLGATVVMVTGETDRIRLAECIEAGAVGVVPKSAHFSTFLDAIGEAATLGSLLSPHQRDELLSELRRQRDEDRDRLRHFERLTPRERHVLGELINGRSAEAIAETSVVALSTVRSQIRAILTKLGVNSQLAAVALARQLRWEPDRS